MELEEMKSQWQQMSKRLEQSEICNESMIKEILNNRSTTLFGKIERFELKLLIFLSIFFCIYLFPIYIEIFGPYGTLVNEFVLAFGFVIQIIKITKIRSIKIFKDSAIDIYKKALWFQTTLLHKIYIYVIAPLWVMMLIGLIINHLLPIIPISYITLYIGVSIIAASIIITLLLLRRKRYMNELLELIKELDTMKK